MYVLTQSCYRTAAWDVLGCVHGSEPHCFSSMTLNNHAVPHWLGKETLGNKKDRKGEHLVGLGVRKVYS